MIIWFKGISGVGKSTLGYYFYKIKKKDIKNLVYIDGDHFRKLFNNDLGYSLEDRNLNAKRLCSFVKFLEQQKINVVIAANLTSKKYQDWARKNFKNYVSIYIESKLSNLKKRDKKKIYIKKKNIVGININFDKPKYSDLYLQNNLSKKKFFTNIKIVNNLLSDKKIKFY